MVILRASLRWLVVSVVLLVATMGQQCNAKEATELKKIPDYIHICDKNDPMINKCVTESVLKLRPFLAEGIPELNVPTIEPLFLGEILAIQGGAGIRIKARDLKAFGCSNFTINRMTFLPDTGFLDFGLDFPQLNIEADYHVGGRILLVPVFGDGPLKAVFNDVKANVTIRGGPVDRDDGHKHYYITDLQVKARVEKGNLYLYNLFGGDKVLGGAVNSAINSNFKIFIQEITPSIEKALSDTIKDISNNVVKAFTYDQLFPIGAAQD